MLLDGRNENISPKVILVQTRVDHYDDPDELVIPVSCNTAFAAKFSER